MTHHHRHREPEERRELSRGEGRGKLLFFDAHSGIAGDMTIAALVDLGVPLAVVKDAVLQLGLPAIEIAVERCFAGAIGALRLRLGLPQESGERHYSEIDALLVEAGLDAGTKKLARKIFRHLAEAEAEVHKAAIEDVHFHEVGALDAIVDIVGAAACLAYLDAEVFVSPLPLGRGYVDCRHGRIPLPAPATLNCLRQVPTYDSGLEAELVTPTGAAIVSSIATDFVRWPKLTPEVVGWGAGTQELADRPNALRVVLGTSLGESLDCGRSEYWVLEANLDDMSGELAAHALSTLLSAGARDAWVVPTTMKKGRPGMTLCALSDAGSQTRLAEMILTETTSLGVRCYPVGRFERPRRSVEVETRFGKVPVKIAEGPYGPRQFKAEFGVCQRLAKEHGVSVREVIQAALSALGG